VKVEGFNFDIRKNLVEYDDVLNRQRDIVYSLRRKILLLPEKNSETFKETIFKIIEEQIVGMSAGFFALNEKDETFIEQFEKDIQLLIEVDKEEIRKKIHESQQEFEEYLLDSAEKQYDVKEKRVGAEVWNQVVRSMFLSTMDQYWTQHLTAIDDLRQGINLRGYAQMDPLVEYKNEAFGMFEKLLSDINYESVRRVMRVQIEEKAPLTEVVDGQTTEKPHFHFQAASGVDPYAGKQQLPQPQQQSQIHTGQTPTIKDNKVSTGPIKKPGRNDVCWCGSGKKYKKCHYPD